jgi:hypothetical protein
MLCLQRDATGYDRKEDKYAVNTPTSKEAW